MAGQFGLAAETTWGTGVTPTKFFEVLSANQTVDEGYMRRQGIRAGRRIQGPPKLGAKVVSGQARMELPNTGGAATLWKLIMGAVNTTGSGPYTHVFTTGAQTGSGKSATIQTGITDASGTVQPFTHTGAKVHQAELSCQVRQFAELSVDWTAKDYTTGTSLASASYAAGLDPFTFVEGTISIDATPVGSARGVTMRWDKALKTDRHHFGSRLINEQLEEGKWAVGGSITYDFENLTMFNHIAAADELDLLLEFDNGSHTLTVEATVIIVGDAPSLTTNGLEEQTLNYEVQGSSTDAAALTVTLVNDEATA